MEEWKPVKGYEGLYEVSNLGRVKSLNYRRTGKEEIMKVWNDSCGYLLVKLHKDGKCKYYTVHRLVAQTFLENPNNLPEVNHIDENKENNKASNLEWCTARYNMEYSHGKAVIGINKVSGLIIEFPSTKEAERQTGISQSHISACCKGKRYKSAGGFYWYYAE